jgi:hypothetical protein
MVATKLLNRGSKVYGTGVKGAHKFVSVGLRTPLKMGMIATKGLPILPGGLKIVNRSVGAGLNTGFGFIGAAPQMAGRGGALLLAPIRQGYASLAPRGKKSPSKKSPSKRGGPSKKSPKRKSKRK